MQSGLIDAGTIASQWMIDAIRTQSRNSIGSVISGIRRRLSCARPGFCVKHLGKYAPNTMGTRKTGALTVAVWRPKEVLHKSV